MADASSGPRPFIRIILIGYSALLLILAGLMLISLVVGIYIVFNITLSGESYIQPLIPLAIYFFGMPLFVLPGIATAGVVLTCLLIVHIVIFVECSRNPKSIFKAARGLTHRGIRGLSNNTLLTIIATFSGLLLGLEGIESIQNILGVPTGTLLTMNPIVSLTFLSYAAIAEEIGFRLGVIGIAAFILLISSGAGTNAIKTLWNPQKYLKELQTDINYKYTMKVMWVMIVVSALLFGGAHILYGGGWEIGKVTLATIAGLVLGWIYVRNGLPGAILLHWSFNYFNALYRYLGEITSFQFFSSITYNLTLISGVFTFIVVLMEFQKKRPKLNV